MSVGKCVERWRVSWKSPQGRSYFRYGHVWSYTGRCAVRTYGIRGQLKCDRTNTETRFRLSAKRTSPFKSARASVQSTTGSRVVRISGSNAGYTMFRGSVKSTGYPLHSPVSPSLPLPCVTVCHHISTGLYCCLEVSTIPEVSVTGQLVFVPFSSALEQMPSWWSKSASHCTLLMQPSTRLCSKFTPARNPLDVNKIAPKCWPTKCKIQRKPSASFFCCILPTAHLPLPFLLYFPTFYLDSRLFLPEGRAGTSWEYSDK